MSIRRTGRMRTTVRNSSTCDVRTISSRARRAGGRPIRRGPGPRLPAHRRGRQGVPSLVRRVSPACGPDEGDYSARGPSSCAQRRTSSTTVAVTANDGLMQEARPVAVEAGDRYTEADTFLIEAMATACVGPQDRAQHLAEAADRVGREMESGSGRRARTARRRARGHPIGSSRPESAAAEVGGQAAPAPHTPGHPRCPPRCGTGPSGSRIVERRRASGR